MIKLYNSVCIESSVEAVWNALADIESVALWAEPVLQASSVGKKSGIGAERVCKLKGNMMLREKWIEWNHGESFTYIASGVPFIKSAKNTWAIKLVDGKVFLSSHAEIELKWGFLGRLLEFIVKPSMNRMGPRSMAAFKYWIENGQPYEGEYSSLGLASADC